MMRSHHRGLLLCQDVVANGGISSPQSKLLNFVTKLIFVEIVDYHSSDFFKLFYLLMVEGTHMYHNCLLEI